MNGKMAKSLKKELLRGDEELIQNLRKLIGIGKTVLFKREQYYKYLKKYYTKGKIKINKTRKEMMSNV